jgi:DNA-binding response OmpR family regulator
VTGVADHDDLTGARFARVLQKPVDPRHLCVAIQAVLTEARVANAVPANVPYAVVILSAVAEPASIERLLALGARAYVTKPLDIGRFLAVVDGSLGGGPAE